MRRFLKPLLIAVVGGLFLVPGPSVGQSSTGSPDPSAEEGAEGRPLAFVRRFKPQVKIFNRASQKYAEAEQGGQLYDGDTLATGENGYAAVQFLDKSLAKVKPSSVLILNGSVDDDTRSTSSRILLNAGEVLMDVNDQGRSDFEVSTSTSVATVKGTRFISDVNASGESTYFVFEGTVSVVANESGERRQIGSGMYARVGADGEDIETGEVSEAEAQDLLEDYETSDEKTQPKTLKFEFRDDDGNVREIKLQYYENEDEQ